METSEAAQRAASQAVEKIQMRRPLDPREMEGLATLLEAAFEQYGETRDARIRELELDQELLLDDVERLNGCLTRAYEGRRSSQERLKSARAEIIKLRGAEPGR